VNLLDDTRARLLERARTSPREFFAPLVLRSGLNVLDVGCGTGDFLRLLAPIVSPGKAVGVDLSATMIAEARQRSAENVDNLSFRVGSVLELPFPVASFDRVLATQLLLHVPDPLKALMEIKRVLAPFGVISITEIDWGTLVVQSSENELGRRFSELACRELRNGLIIRELPGQLRELGFNHILIAPEVGERSASELGETLRAATRSAASASERLVSETSAMRHQKIDVPKHNMSWEREGKNAIQSDWKMVHAG